jgi:hypothetical protein
MPTTPYRPTIQQSPDAGDLTTLVEVAARVTDTLPSEAPASWRRLTYRAVLAAALRDAVENGTEGLEAEDETNLARFVQDASRAAGRAPAEHGDDAYELVLGALLDDWVDNWDSAPSDDDEEDEDEDDDE